MEALLAKQVIVIRSNDPLIAGALNRFGCNGREAAVATPV